MRADSANFAAANTAANKRPRVVIALSFDTANTDLLYLTSHADCELPAAATSANTIANVVRGIDGQTQQLNPDTANATIGGFSFSAVDKNSAITQYIRDKLVAGDGLRHKRIVVYVGYVGLLWDDYARALTYIIDGISYKDGVYSFKCSDVQRIIRKDIFEPEITYLTKSVTANAWRIPCLATNLTKFPVVAHDTSYTDRPSVSVSYTRIEDEIVCHTGLFTHGTDGVCFEVQADYTGAHTGSNNAAALADSGAAWVTNAFIGLIIRNTTDGSEGVITANTATTVTATLAGGTDNDWDTSDAYKIYTGRGALNTKAVEHVVDSSAAAERRLKITEHVFIEGARPKVVYALLTGSLAENLFTYSADFTNAVWTDPSAEWTVTGNTDTAPDGTTTADEITVTSAGNALIRFVPSPTIAGGGTYTCAVWARIKSGTVSSGLGIDLGDVAQTITELTSQWQRVVFTGASHATNNYVDLQIVGASAGATVLLWGAQLSLTAGAIPYYPTTATARSKQTLPSNWHLGVSAEYVRAADFYGIGHDMWNPADDTGSHCRIDGHKKVDGKKLIETELLFWLGAFMPVYATGELGLRRLSPVLSSSGYVVKLDRTNIVDYGDLNHDHGAVINYISVDWNFVFSKDDFTKTTLLIDEESRGIHQDAPQKNIKLYTVHTGSNTDDDLYRSFDSIRSRYAGPPLRLSVTVMPSLNWLEVGDTVFVELDEIRDFTNGSIITLARTFEIQRVNFDWLTGHVKLELFGSSMRAGAISRTSASAVLDDAFYNSAGTELSTVLTIASGAVTANGSLTGGATMAAGIYYYLGDLTINAGVTVNITQNVELRIRGHLTINGTIDGVGGGGAGGAGAALWSNGSTVIVTAFNAPAPQHNGGIGGAGYLGITSPTRGGFNRYNGSPVVQGAAAVPYFALKNLDTNLIGLPVDLRGVGGSGGDAVWSEFGTNGSARTHTLRVAGSAGGNGGAGLAVISRGASLGISGSINLSGVDAIENTNAVYNNGAYIYHGMAGAGGAPGGFALYLDGNHTPPDLVTELVSLQGNSPYGGNRASPVYGSAPHLYGTNPGYAGFDMGDSAYTLQYIPEYNVPQEEIDPPPPDVTGLTAVNDGLNARLNWNAIANNTTLRYRIKTGTTWSSGVFIADVALTAYLFYMASPATYDFMVKAVDVNGVESQNVASVSLVGVPVVGINANVSGADDYKSSTFFYHNRFETLDGFTSVSATLNTQGYVTIGSTTSSLVSKSFFNPTPPLLWANTWRFKCIFMIPAGQGTQLNNTIGQGLIIGVGDHWYSFFGVNLHWSAGLSQIAIQARTTNSSTTNSFITSIADTGLLIEVECVMTPGVGMTTNLLVGGVNYTNTIITNLPAAVPFGVTSPLVMNAQHIGNKALSTARLYDYMVQQQ